MAALWRLAAAFFLCMIVGVAFAGGALPVSALTVLKHDASSVEFTVEVAANAADRETGLMNRTALADDHGMIFVFPRPKPVMMWMKDTLIPLDMLFIDDKGVIVNIAVNANPMDETIINSRGSVAYVLELAGGGAKRFGLADGDKVIGKALGFTARD
jgi:uncharacterized protein